MLLEPIATLLWPRYHPAGKRGRLHQIYLLRTGLVSCARDVHLPQAMAVRAVDD